nr:LytTR family DNA-binding domain-containing protein [uncultured Brevundimonas sp.]
MHRLGRAPVRVVVGVFAAYSFTATVVSVSWYLRRSWPALSIPSALAWATLSYAPWLGVALLIWAMLRRFGAGWRAAGVLAAAMPALASLIALLNASTDLAFLNREWTWAEGVSRTIDRLPVVILLYTALVAASFAAVAWVRTREAHDQIRILTAALATARAVEGEQGQRLLVATGRARAPVAVGDIEWLASAGNYVVVHWQGREGLVRDTLQAMETRLDPRLFTRIHRSSLINLARVDHVDPLSDGSWRLTMASGAALIVSRTYRDAVLERLGRKPPTSLSRPSQSF